jgi:hypothetical protein
MSNADQGKRDAVALLTEEVTATMESSSGNLSAVRKKEVQEVLSEFADFSESADTGPGYDRIVIKKDSKWLPMSGKSVKAGNLRFNLGKLFESAVSSAGVYFTSVAHPIFAVFTGIVALRSLMKAATVEIEERDAWVLWALWISQQHSGASDSATILQRLNEEGQRYGKAIDMSVKEVETRLERLEKIRAVRLRDGQWGVVEAVIVST